MDTGRIKSYAPKAFPVSVGIQRGSLVEAIKRQGFQPNIVSTKWRLPVTIGHVAKLKAAKEVN